MRVLKRIRRLITLLLAIAILHHLSNVATRADVFSDSQATSSQDNRANLAARFGHLRRGVNLSHWFSQAADYSKTRLATHTTVQDIARIKSMGFDHVRFPIEPAPLMGDDPSVLNATYLQYVDNALDMILATG